MADRIIHAADAYRVGSGAEAVHRTFGPLLSPPRRFNPPTKVRPAIDQVVAWVNDGRWVVVCPNCGEGQIASKDDPRFICFQCQNLVVNGEWRPVVFPKQVVAIEKELLRRSRFENRVWLPGETVGDLKKEWDAAELAFAGASTVVR